MKINDQIKILCRLDQWLFYRSPKNQFSVFGESPSTSIFLCHCDSLAYRTSLKADLHALKCLKAEQSFWLLFFCLTFYAGSEWNITYLIANYKSKNLSMQKNFITSYLANYSQRLTFFFRFGFFLLVSYMKMPFYRDTLVM